ncbi:MAG TPA: c-type cytochrome [Bryobacteraceae bacterium]|nr:c-type cytochrome [Bryobacteraceae bacterium]
MRWDKPVLRIGVALVLARAGLGQQPGGRSGEASPDAAAVERGSQIYRPNCGFCHGLDARGAAGPDLARSLIVLEDVDGKKLDAFLKTGRPDAGMPAFGGLASQQSADLAAFLHARIEESRARAPMDVNAIVVGNAAEGAAFFNGAGKCRGCHNPEADFKGIGSKYDPFALQARIINPRGGVRPARPSTVRVTLPSGETIAGRLVAVDDFSVALVDGAGVRRSFSRDNEVPKVEIVDPYQAHLDNFLKITDKQMHDLTAYLVTLK